MLVEKVKKLNELNETKQLKSYRAQDIALILKLIVLDGLTDLNKITSKTFVDQKQVEKYLKNKEIMKEFLTEDEYNEFLEYYNKLTNFLELKANLDKNKLSINNKSLTKNTLLISNIVSDIMNTRLSLTQIYINNFISNTTFRKILSNKQLLDSMYGEGFTEILKAKIIQNGNERKTKPRNLYLVEEKNDVLIIKDEAKYLDSVNYRRMKTISCYLSNECDLEFVEQTMNLSKPAILNVLLNKNNQEIMRPEAYEVLCRFAQLERIWLEGTHEERINIVQNIILTLENNNYDIDLVSTELVLPINILKRYLNLNLVRLYYPEQFEKINNIFNEQEENKKGLK